MVRNSEPHHSKHNRILMDMDRVHSTIWIIPVMGDIVTKGMGRSKQVLHMVQLVNQFNVEAVVEVVEEDVVSYVYYTFFEHIF